MDRKITTTDQLRMLALVFGVCAMLLGTFVVSPTADAQAVQYARDTPSAIFPAGPTCTYIGTVTDSPEPTLNDDFCRPVGFTPLTTLAQCEAVATLFGVQYGFSPSTTSCFVDVYLQGSVPCETPTVFIPGDMVLTIAGGTSTTNEPVPFVGCGFVILSNEDPTVTPPPMPMGPISFIAETAATTACIDSPEVQDDPAAANMGLGETFVGQNGNRFSITTGGPTCTFTGEGCDANLNLLRVSDVKLCLTSLEAVAPAAPVADPEEDVSSAPAAAAPVAAPVSSTQLAQTGEKHERGAAFAGALVGTGVSVLAAARLFGRRRRTER